MKKNTLIVEDHKLISNNLKDIIKTEVEIIGTASDITHAKAYLVNNKVDIILLDLMLGEDYSFELMEFIDLKYENIKVIVISALTQLYYIKRSMNFKCCHAFLSKNIDSEELLATMKLVVEGEEYYSSDVREVLNHNYKNVLSNRNEIFTNREMKILNYIYQEKSNKTIAEELNLSVRTVDAHKRNLISKVGAKNLVGLIRYVDEIGGLKLIS